MKSIALLLSTTALALSAQAATVSFSFDNPFELTDIDQTGSLGLFDSSLGTLTGVSLEFRGANKTTITLTNNSAKPATVSATSTTNLYFGSSLAGLNTMITEVNPVIVLTSSTGPSMQATGESKTFGPISGSKSIPWSLELVSQLSEFTAAGGGTFAVSCSSTSGLVATGAGGNVAQQQSTIAGCGATVAYIYDAAPAANVPEPETLALVGIALAGLALSRRKG